MRTITVTELRRNATEVFRAVESGESFIVTRRNRPIVACFKSEFLLIARHPPRPQARAWIRRATAPSAQDRPDDRSAHPGHEVDVVNTNACLGTARSYWDYNEYKLEEEIAEHLAANGGTTRAPTTVTTVLAHSGPTTSPWLEETQPDQFAKYGRSDVVLDALVKRLNTPMEAGGGSLNVLRRGFQHIAASFRMAQFQPESSHNETAVANYARNRLRVVRQVHFSTADNRSIDMVLFVNGIPVATIELKTDFTQSVDDAVEQYRRDRKNPRPTAATSHCSVSAPGAGALRRLQCGSPMTTRLAGRRPTSYRSTGELPTAARATRQLPTANRPPRTCGKKSSPATRCSASSAGSCTWKVVATDPITGGKDRSTRLLFPRFHQWDAVRKLAATTAAEGSARSTLIQHSAGGRPTPSRGRRTDSHDCRSPTRRSSTPSSSSPTATSSTPSCKMR